MNIPLNIDWQQILLHLLNFAILAGGLYLLLYKPVKAFLAKRERFYQDQADQAEKTRREAEALKAEAQARADAAGEEAKAIREKARQDALADAQGLQHGAGGFIVLPGQYLRRGHHGRLIPCAAYQGDGPEGQGCFSAAYVPLHQTAHGPVLPQVGGNFR